jgi:hypothetical protein
MWVVFSVVALVWVLFVPLNGAGCKQISGISLALPIFSCHPIWTSRILIVAV